MIANNKQITAIKWKDYSEHNNRFNFNGVIRLTIQYHRIENGQQKLNQVLLKKCTEVHITLNIESHLECLIFNQNAKEYTNIWSCLLDIFIWASHWNFKFNTSRKENERIKEWEHLYLLQLKSVPCTHVSYFNDGYRHLPSTWE